MRLSVYEVNVFKLRLPLFLHTNEWKGLDLLSFGIWAPAESGKEQN